MAYNRIYLKCRVCGGEFMLAKSYGNGFYREDYNGDGVLKGFNNFLNRHTFCGDSCEEGDYVLEYEMEPRRELKKRLFGEEKTNENKNKI